ncbi:MAG: hypothetical protein J4N28_03815 [Chloroflexi bacterium]|nr:hypothetical protein [Chloroflexota bacterium]
MSKQYQVGEFKVRLREAAVGPLVRGYAKRDPDGQRHLLDLPLEPEALPPPASESQMATLAVGITYWVLSEHALPEMSRRIGRQVGVDRFYASPHWQKWLKSAQVAFHGGSEYDVRLNADVILPPPPDGHITLIRERATWSGQPVRILGDWLPLFTAQVRDQTRQQVDAVARDILSGTEGAAHKIVDSWFPLERERSVDPIYGELPKEVFALLSRNPRRDPTDVLFAGFRPARDALHGDYDWANLDGTALFGSGAQARSFDDAKEEMVTLWNQAGLTERQQRIIGLECVLSTRGEHWANKHKAQYLGLRTGNYEEGLSTARRKLKKERAVGTAFQRLVNTIFQPGLTAH